MNDGFSGPAAAALLAKYGTSAAFGMIGAVCLYIVLPPTDTQGRFSKTEFASRLFIAGVFSIFFGGMLADALAHVAPFLKPHDHRSAVDLMAGAPGWWVSRLIAVYFHKRRDADFYELADELRRKR